MAYNPSHHVCGLYYNTPVHGALQKTYLPQVELQAHAIILATTSRTVLRQTFVNPSAKKGIREVRYTFPLYDGVSVVGFACHVGDRTIVGEVKEKEKARAVFNEAVARGETAGLFEQLPEASDVFTTTVGNIAPGARLVVEITYLGELKHDMEVDGTRFTIPNIICPRYGNYPGSFHTSNVPNAKGSGISITVDAEMADGSFIQKLQSPTHPIAMTMGTTSANPDAEPSMTKASATLSLGTTELDKDFVLQIIAKNAGVPKAVLETHPTIPNHRALMATLVPKFALPADKPELVFVCDRSGSMSGSNISLVIAALKVFLKSLPVGVKFNICSFGSSYSFLWEKSVTYSQQTLDEAIRHADSFTANYGGTEMLNPLRATIEQRYKDMPLDIMLLTDGGIWNQQNLFNYLNQVVVESKTPIRAFTLGIGYGVSHALIEGIAAAGNGFSQSVGQGEKMDTKVVRMLKGALSPHVDDYTLEVKYGKDSVTTRDKDDFEIVEKVADSLKVKLDLNEPKSKESKAPISLFDSSADPDKEESPVPDETGEARYAHLPMIDTPKIIQSPQKIPPLFAFNRTTVYLLLGPEAPTATPKAIVLRGTSTRGPLELEIPIQTLEQEGQTIHQLAAKKAIAELEQGRGWLPEAKDESGELLKANFEGRFQDMIECEAVRLGVQFQVGGKWCSFVAVESNKVNKQETEKISEDWEFLDDKPVDFVNTTSTNYSESADFSFDPSSESDSSDDGCVGANRFLRDVGSESEDITSQSDDHLVLAAIHRLSKPYSQASNQQPLTAAMAAQQMAVMQRLVMSAQNQALSQGMVHMCLASRRPISNTPAAPAASQREAPNISEAYFSAAPHPGSSPWQPAAPTAPSTAATSSPSLNHVASLGPGVRSRPCDPHELQDYQMRLMLLEQQNKKRLLMQRQALEMGSNAQVPLPPPPPPPTVPAPAVIQENVQMSDDNHSPDLGSGFGDASALQNFDFDSFLSPASPGYSPVSNPDAASVSQFGSSTPPYPPSGVAFGGVSSGAATSASPFVTASTPEDLMRLLISLQGFEGSWDASLKVLGPLQITEAEIRTEATKIGIDMKIFVTALLVAVFEKRLMAFEGSWELVVEKAKSWLADQVDAVDAVNKLIREAGKLVK